MRFLFALASLYILSFALMVFAVPDRDDPEPGPEMTGDWVSHCWGMDDYYLTVTRGQDGTLRTAWVDLDTGDVVYRGVLAWDGDWLVESYGLSPPPEFFKRCRWQVLSESPPVLRSEHKCWTIRRPEKVKPDL